MQEHGALLSGVAEIHHRFPLCPKDTEQVMRLCKSTERNILSWPADKFHGIQARMLDRFHFSGRSGDLAGCGANGARQRSAAGAGGPQRATLDARRAGYDTPFILSEGRRVSHETVQELGTLRTTHETLLGGSASEDTTQHRTTH